ncbi:uncharacterized protein LOC127735083 isoform X1 [Mytilus californianus]|uniref:uncharacterized protein LOC127735083 isoform X1 n=1 Tax=Mytilus californianus TaxID=6549 RepID=UPI0022487134|nr:uncharacterized protein LOC127735083 isoform X1 [Mytilus californianus]XP_052101138.1 uncharacterized protein LOC127735083 isoform X1 [Mytilus californianus]XP_052101139.1 uncharacterized protein LOC127735083 isoform X1 [Mytilus californianus]XP_052101140.1 uncharacterized protein LOC127735083 isoform X1 [Mytilus californianus]
MGCGDSKSSSGQTPRGGQPQDQRAPNKFDRLSEIDSQSTKTQNSTALYGGRAAAKWKRAVAEKNASVKGSKNSTTEKDARNRNARKGKRNQAVKEPVNEKGYKKRIRENLRQAATGSDIEEIEHAIELFEKNKLEDNGDLEDAQERLEFLYLRKEIRDAILRRHPGILDKAIANVQSSQYRSELMHYLENAKALKQHLTELNRFSHDILKMQQETISELRSYINPPAGVKEVMKSTYLIIGYEESKLKEWADIQILLGRHGREKLLREVEKADTVNLDEHTCKRVEQLQKDFTIDDIRSVSNGAATFYLWNQNMSRKYSKDKQRSAGSNPPPAANRKKNKG